MNIVKKRNPDSQNDGPQQPMLPRDLPVLRTFVVEKRLNKRGDFIDSTVEAHGVAFDDAGMVSFIVFFWVDADKTQPAQANKLVIAAGAWNSVVEINPLFPVMEKH